MASRRATFTFQCYVELDDDALRADTQFDVVCDAALSALVSSPVRIPYVSPESWSLADADTVPDEL